MSSCESFVKVHTKGFTSKDNVATSMDGDFSNNQGAKASTASVRGKGRACEKGNCTAKELKCALNPLRNCRQVVRSRWHHLSPSEHVCDRCIYSYRNSERYDEWARQWSMSCTVEPNVKLYIAYEVLPIWLRCTEPNCGKWRPEWHLSAGLPAHSYSYKCNHLTNAESGKDCQTEQDPIVSHPLETQNWVNLLDFQPLFRNVPGFQSLKEYSAMDIGMYPIHNNNLYSMPRGTELFNKTTNTKSVPWVNVEKMDAKEVECIPKSILSPATYLALRNLIVSLWHMSPSERMTKEKVSMYLDCRGLVRIYLLSLVDYIIEFLTQRGLINFGLVPLSGNYTFCADDDTADVIIIGAGIAGLIAARHFHNVGIKYVVLEATGRVGGRVYDEYFSKGSQIIYGLINNPFTLLAHQAKSTIQVIPHDPLFLSADEDRPVYIEHSIVNKMCDQFCGVMDSALEISKEFRTESAWFETIKRNELTYERATDFPFTSEEKGIFNVLLKLYEIETRTNIKTLTLMNFEFSKFFGADGYVVGGMGSLVQKLADPLVIQRNSEVTSITSKDGKVSVKVRERNKCFTAHKVLVTVPLPILHGDDERCIQFNPKLPESKITAFSSLSTSFHEKVFLQFPEKFWNQAFREKDDFPSTFIIISSQPMPFQYFMDISCSSSSKAPTLLTFVTDSMRDALKDKTQKDIVDMCVTSLRMVFSKFNKTVPSPDWWSITDWANDPHFLTSGCYVPTHSSYDVFDEIAKPVKETIFFAGEAAFRASPNSLIGAFHSGLRTAVRIAEILRPLHPLNVD